MALNYDRERRRKDGIHHHLGGNPVFLAIVWLFWAVMMSYIACWLASGLLATYAFFHSPESYAILGSNIPPGLFNGVFAGWSFRHLGDYSILQTKPLWFLVIEAILAGMMLPLVHKSRRKWKPNSHNQYGNDRLTTEKEIQKQYPQIPDRGFTFPGYGGIPVSHAAMTDSALIKHHPAKWLKYCVCPWTLQWISKVPSLAGVIPFREYAKGFYAIDQQAVNSLIVGITRSGKGETLVMPLVDILSRAAKKASMVLNDPKGELYQMAYNILRKRGYKVEVLNIQNTDFSMSYNPLQKIIDYAKDGYFDEVQQEVNTLSSSIYVDPNAKDKFWQNSSINLLNALIIAVIDYAKRNDKWSEVTMDNVLHMMTELGSKQVLVNKEGEVIPTDKDLAQDPETPVPDDTEPADRKNKLIVYFEQMQKLNEVNFSQFRQMALDAFAQSKFAGDETSGNIYSSAMEGIKIYQQTNIAKLTSKNSVNFESLGFPRVFKMKLPKQFRFKTAVLEFRDQSGKRLEKRTQLVDKVGMVNYAIETKLPDNFSVKITFNYRKNDPSVRTYEALVKGHKVYQTQFGHVKRDPYSNQPILKKVELQPDNGQITFSKLVMDYSEAPVALFLVTPPNNPSYNQLPAFAVDQIFNANYSMAMNNGRKCFRRIHFILDEFGGMPTINDMNVKVQIGLGQNICFDLVVQNLEQLDIKYSKEQASTIQSNCSNLLYILTKSEKTAKTISNMIGKRTVEVQTSNGRYGNLHNVNYNTSFISQDILSMNDLLKLMGGEMVVLRSVYRQDQKGHSVSAMPIFDHGKTKMPYRYTFLRREFNDQTTLSDIGIVSSHRNLDLQSMRINYDRAYNQIVNLMLQSTDGQSITSADEELGNRLGDINQELNDSNHDNISITDENQSIDEMPKVTEGNQPINHSSVINSIDDMPSDYVVSFNDLHDQEYLALLTRTLYQDLNGVLPVEKRKALFQHTHDVFKQTRYNSWSGLTDLFGGDTPQFSKFKQDLLNLQKQFRKEITVNVAST
ncbi:VirD4-like conjugal transfer protein, CD1115 family [uncultured Limosilactobacillus sp.]|uniref:VirD4-like conjugal transfer protein, CD1115 family n=1 Tax=uncultured Limosilactobacillus sp. TaxID=2837629 RepID=UPI0025F956EE|nr:type IV secretory system conjugative DNA transfer family protein [uncultured Limosilactobacillus sp.]